MLTGIMHRNITDLIFNTKQGFVQMSASKGKSIYGVRRIIGEMSHCVDETF